MISNERSIFCLNLYLKILAKVNLRSMCQLELWINTDSKRNNIVAFRITQLMFSHKGFAISMLENESVELILEVKNSLLKKVIFMVLSSSSVVILLASCTFNIHSYKELKKEYKKAVAAKILQNLDHHLIKLRWWACLDSYKNVSISMNTAFKLVCLIYNITG